jgi:2,4-dienoyl-CoA reductase-like NADH-dependent reductase (Old Yellow Enzyme family)
MPIAVVGTTQSKARCRIYGLIAALAVAFVFTAAALPAAAQQSAPTEISQEQLAAFAAAAQRVQELNQKWIPQINQAGSDAENAQMREQAMQEMTAAVRDEGLTVEEYNQIYDAAQRSPEVMQQIEEHHQSLQ